MAIIVIAKNGVENDDDPAVPTQVYVDAFCVFAFMFITLLAARVFLLGETHAATVIYEEFTTWSCALALLYMLL